MVAYAFFRSVQLSPQIEGRSLGKKTMKEIVYIVLAVFVGSLVGVFANALYNNNDAD